jgi:hypothetical protein
VIQQHSPSVSARFFLTRLTPRLRTAGRGEGDDNDAVELKLRIPKGYE